jgi:hypothetical protein
VAWEPGSYTGYTLGSRKAGNASGSELETRQAQLKTIKEMSNQHSSKSGSLLGLREVIMSPGSLAAMQGTCQAVIRLETRQAHMRLETRQAQGWKPVRLT